MLAPSIDTLQAVTKEKRPLDELESSVRSRRCGEFIFATNSVEVHVFLQHGRLAWATDSSHPFEFARFLKERCGIDDEAFRDVLEECRRLRTPVGQTLVGWELATWDDVHASLRRQIALALRTLATTPDGATIFLSRQHFAEYDEKLTFELGELLREADSPPPEPPSSVSLRTVPAADGPPASSLPLSSRSWSAQKLLERIRGASWISIAEGQAVDTATVGPAPSLPAGVADATLYDGADFVAVRSADGCLIGARLAPASTSPDEAGSELWCMLGNSSAFRKAIAAVASLGLSRQSRLDWHVASEPIAWRKGHLDASWASEVEQVFAYGGEVYAVALLSAEGELVAGVGRSNLDADTCAALARRRAGVLSVALAGADGELEALGFRFRTMVTGESSVWCFGAELHGPGQAATLWVMVGREASQGVGWACLTALLRHCQQAPEVKS